MTPDDAVEAFARTRNALPTDAIEWARGNWAEARPAFLDLLRRYVDGEDRGDRAEAALFLVIHMFGEMRESSALPLLHRLLRDPEAAEGVLGDAVTETLPGLLISMHDGDPGPLQDLIERDGADEYIRVAALFALAHLARAGAWPEDEMQRYLRHLHAQMQPRHDAFIWAVWAIVAACLGYEDLAAAAHDLWRRGFIDRSDMGMHDFDRLLRRGAADPRGFAALEAEGIRPFDDTIGSLEGWAAFLPPRERSGMPDAAWDDGRQKPAFNPLRDVGRNDPCPCGSGRKYKKCCLHAGAGATIGAARK